MKITDDQELLVAMLTLIHTRQHVSPGRQDDPSLRPDQIERTLGAAGAAPDQYPAEAATYVLSQRGNGDHWQIAAAAMVYSRLRFHALAERGKNGTPP